MEKISFIILSWNSEKYLNACLDSILQISKYEIEIFIVDNGSKDRSVEIIKSFNSHQINLIILDKNYGTTISRNKALHSLKNTDFICILDSDTIINEDAVEYMCKFLNLHKEAGIVGPTMLNNQGEKQIPYRRFPTWKIKLYKASPFKKINLIGEKLESYDYDNLPNEFECDYLISACWMLRYDTYIKNGDFDEKIFYSPEDVEYCMRVRSNGYRIFHLKEPKIIHFYQRISKKKLISKANLTHLLGLHYVLHKYKTFLKNYKA